uniref:Uncharacterized protein n=1 Tax=Avena sativa TaxID=4498 RepID=A0ACD5ZWX8_AVESA
MPRRKPQPTSKKPERRSPRKRLTKSTAAMPDSIDPIPSQPPQEASPAATKPDPEMPPRKSHTGGGKLRKPITGKLRAAAEERLAQLRIKFRLHPLDPPPQSLSAASSPHEAALRSIGLLDFVRLGLQSEPPRPDLVSQLIAYYDQAQHRSFVWDNRVSVSRTDFARALSLPPKPAPTASPPDVDPTALVSAVQEFVRVYVLPPFNGGEMCELPPEVVAAEQAVKDESAHKVDWAGLIWGLVEKEILELPKRGDRVCYFWPYLQRLISMQKPELFELREEKEKGNVVPVVSLDLDMDEDDGDASKSSDELEPKDAKADVRNNLMKESEIEGAPLTSNRLDKLESEDADADTRSNLVEESMIEGACLRSNNLDELESGDADADTRSKDILHESEIKGAPLRSNNLDEPESGDADADMSSKIISEEPKIEGTPLRSSNLDELESGDVDVDTRSKTLEESETEGACLRSSNLDELGDVDANASVKISEASMVADEDAKGMNLDESKVGDELGLGFVASESVGVTHEARTLNDEASEEMLMVADEDAKGMNLDESKVGDELGLGFVASEPVGVSHEARTSNDEASEELLHESDEGLSVGAAQKDGSQSMEMLLTTQGEVLTVPEEDEDEDAEDEEEKGKTVWSCDSANDDENMDAEENVSVENLDDVDSDNEEGEESEQDGFEGRRGAVEMDWGIENENGGEGTTHCLQSDFPRMEFENLNKEDVRMRDGMSFNDGFSEKLGSMHGMESTNLLQAMNSIPATYNGTENAHDLNSGDFLAMGADAHRNGVDLGTGSSFFFGNNGKRHIGDINGYNDQMQAQQQFLQGNQQKRMRNCNSSVSPGSSFFSANISEPIHNLLSKASMFYEQKEKELEEALSQKQYMANLMQEKDALIQSLNSARFEQDNKYQAKLKCFEYDLNVMGQLVTGYKKALKQSQASFSEYRKKFPSNKFLYHDVPNSGGLVVSVNELERKRREEEQQNIAAANEMIEHFQREWFSKPDQWTERIAFLCGKTEELAREIDLLKEKRKAKVATLATEE